MYEIIFNTTKLKCQVVVKGKETLDESMSWEVLKEKKFRHSSSDELISDKSEEDVLDL